MIVTGETVTVSFKFCSLVMDLCFLNKSQNGGFISVFFSVLLMLQYKNGLNFIFFILLRLVFV